MTKRLLSALILLLLVLLAGCRDNSSGTTTLNGRILLWHSWNEEEKAVLDRALNQFMEINKDVNIISVRLPEDELLTAYIEVADDGMGPDLLLGNDAWIRELADANLIRPWTIDAVLDVPYSENTLDAVSYEGQLFGTPMSLAPIAAYYNKALTSVVPLNLEGLLELANDEQPIALVPRFEPAYWGIQAFGHGLFDQEGNFTLDDSGFTEWLTWLKNTQDNPHVIQNVDAASLLELFLTGYLAFYTAGPEILPLVKESLGQDGALIMPLPGGPEGSAGPLLPVSTIFLNESSADRQVEIGLALARYLANPQQSITFMRRLNHVPANRRVVVDRRVYPDVAGFSTQARSAVALPNDIIRNQFFIFGDAAYASTLSGLLTPEEAVCRFGQQVVELQNYSPDEAFLPDGCLPESWTTTSSEPDVSDDK